MSLLHFTLLYLTHYSRTSRFLDNHCDHFPSEFYIIFDFDKNSLCIFNLVIDKIAEQDEARDTENPPNNVMISKPCFMTNKRSLQ